MNKNMWWWIIGIIAVVLIILYFSGAVTGNAVFQRYVNAHSCSADSVCEANSVLSDIANIDVGNFDSINSHWISVIHGFQQGNAVTIDKRGSGNALYVNAENSSKGIKVASIDGNGIEVHTAYGIALDADASTALGGIALRTDGNVVFEHLTPAFGNDTAYLCIDGNNSVYKSYNPCV